VDFLQDRGDLPPQLKYSLWLIDVAFLTDLTAKLNELNTKLQGENKTIIKMTIVIEPFKGKRDVWKTRLMKGHALAWLTSLQPQSSPAWSQATEILDHICTDLEQ
jgi:acid stress-induced BolA-like protein IbaG/YrbA